MKVLIACEFSGIVRDAFIARGHNAVSCDLLPTERPGPHRQTNVSHVVKEGWDLMIAHPPCTYLTVAANKHMMNNPRRWVQRVDALFFIHELLNASIEKIALENPVGVISSHIRQPDQIIQPYDFGDDASKQTCLWLKNLPKLEKTKYMEPRIVNGKKRWSNQTDISGSNVLCPSDDRGKLRSITYQGIALAMAEQWG